MQQSTKKNGERVNEESGALTETAGTVPASLGDEEQGWDRSRKAPHAYRTISEVADELHVPQHVLRFWETRFPEVKPLKRGGGRRYYRPEDIVVLRRISDLLYVQGYTIRGVQRVLREKEVELPPVSGGGVSDREVAVPVAGLVGEVGHPDAAGIEMPEPVENSREEGQEPQPLSEESEALVDDGEKRAGSSAMALELAELDTLRAETARLLSERAEMWSQLSGVLEELEAIRALLPA